MHKSIFTKTDIFHKYTKRNNRWVTVEWAWKNGDRNGKGVEDMKQGKGRKDKTGEARKMGEGMKRREEGEEEEEEWSER